MAILNYTTDVPVDRSVQQIHKALVKAKASAVLNEYDTNGNITAVSFRVATKHGTIHYCLPANVEGVHAVLSRSEGRHVRKSKEQAARVAWRICKDWVESQMAIVEAEMATLPQVFLPYAKTASGETVYERFEKQGMTMLTDQRNGQ